tara:strand:- start:21225 stop:22148 length:924 start_codon:yes stop_codon:yes gene_type:complete
MSINGTTTTTEETGSWGLLGRFFSIPSYVWSGVEPTVVNNTVIETETVIEEVIVPTIPTASELAQMVKAALDINGDGSLDLSDITAIPSELNKAYQSIDFDKVNADIRKFCTEKPAEYAKAYQDFLETLPHDDYGVAKVVYTAAAVFAMYTAAKIAFRAIGNVANATKDSTVFVLKSAAEITVSPIAVPVATISWGYKKATGRNSGVKALTGPEAKKPFEGTTREAAFGKLDADSPFVKWMTAASADVVAVVNELKDQQFDALTKATQGFIFGKNSAGHSIETASADSLRNFFVSKSWLEPRQALKM